MPPHAKSHRPAVRREWRIRPAQRAAGALVFSALFVWNAVDTVGLLRHSRWSLPGSLQLSPVTGLLAVACALAVGCMFRARVAVDGEWLLVRNLFAYRRLPLREVTAVRSGCRFGLTFHAGGRRVSCLAFQKSNIAKWFGHRSWAERVAELVLREADRARAGAALSAVPEQATEPVREYAHQ
ncbi:hypothetical protein ACFQVC_38150 [Streptomyces monticola]|uniref:PH domain-containing protein n=1 Tax=Streptomyces monticola TaxID=2666263 RepID=A0ABW2JWZ8_9ACTN